MLASTFLVWFDYDGYVLRGYGWSSPSRPGEYELSLWELVDAHDVQVALLAAVISSPAWRGRPAGTRPTSFGPETRAYIVAPVAALGAVLTGLALRGASARSVRSGTP